MMDWTLPDDIGIYECMQIRLQRDFIRYREYYRQVENLDEYEIQKIEQNIMDAGLTPFKNIRDGKASPETIKIAKHVSYDINTALANKLLGSLGDEMLSNIDKTIDCLKIASEVSRITYDNVIGFSHLK